MLLLCCILCILSVSLALIVSPTANELPSVQVKNCKTGEKSQVIINQTSNGTKSSVGTSLVELCYTESHLEIFHVASGQAFYPTVKYSNCNDPVFNSDVFEVFVAPYIQSDEGAYCYSEVDLSPYNTIYESGIYNPNLTRASISNYPLDCDHVPIKHSATISESSNEWQSSMSIPWEVLNCPKGCPLSSYCTRSSQPKDTYRINFYRINELRAVSSCDDVNCEYLAWSPTLATPPSFHGPARFGFLELI